MNKLLNTTKKISLYYLIFSLITLIIVISGYSFYKSIQNDIKFKAQDNLSTIADLKVQQIMNWREERISDGRFIYNNEVIKELVYFYLSNPYPFTKQKIITWLTSVKENPEYTNISIIDTSGRLYSLFAEKDSLTTTDLIYYKDSIKKNKIILDAFYKNPITKEINLSCFIPLSQRYREEGKIFGMILIRIDPKTNLFPLIQSRSNISPSSETFIVRRDSNKVTCLSELRSKKNSALTFNIPLWNYDLPEVRAVKGWKGIFEGIDYREMEVLADINKIPDSDWFIISKIDIDEIYAPLRQQLLFIFAGIITLTSLSGSILYSKWKSRKLKYLSEQLKLERENKALQEHIDYLYQNANEIILMIDLSYQIKRTNNEALKVYGYSYDEFLNLTVIDLRAPEEKNKVDENFSKIRENNGYVFETLHMKKNGEIFPVEISSNIIKIEDVEYYQSFIRDITDRKRAENELRTRATEMEGILSCIADGVMVYDTTGKIIKSNKAADEIITYQQSRDETLKERITQNLSVWTEDGKELNSDEMPDIRAAIFAETTRGIALMLKGYSEPRWLSVSAAPLFVSGNHTGAVVSMSDITKRKRAEEALRESEERFRIMADSSPFIIWVSDTSGKIQFVNKTFLEFFNLTLDQITEQKWLSIIHPDDRLSFTETFHKAVKKHNSFKAECRVKHANSSWRWISSHGEPRFSYNGNFVGHIVSSPDITEQKSQQQKLEIALMNLQRSNKDLEQFAYTASHDLQEPIRMIKNYAQLLEKKYIEMLDSKATEYLNFILEGATRMQSLVTDLLKYSRITTSPIEFETVDLNSVLKDVLDDLKFRIMEVGAEVKVNHLPCIKGNRTQLRQLFQNFIQNAIKFRSERKPEIIISAMDNKTNWLFSIQDNGIGIESKYFDRIFVIFQRLHEREKYEGTGMGLALCKKIVERHGGQVCVESEIGRGSVFYFTLPE